LEVGLLDADLIVDGDGATLRGSGGGGFAEARVIRLAAAHYGIDESGRSGAEIESGEGGAIGRLKQGLVFGSGEEEFRGAISIVIQHFHARPSAVGGELIGKGFRANEPAPKLRAEMRRVKATEYTVPV